MATSTAYGLSAAAIAIVLLGPASPARAQSANVKHGGEVFATECAECHSVREGKDKKGPSLFGVVGAAAAQRAGFAYSEALRGSGAHWTRDVLDAYVANPQKAMPGGKMKYDGLASAPDRADLLAYLASLGPK
jgi:cytochrome c